MKQCLKIIVSGKFPGETYQTYAQKHAISLSIEGTLQQAENNTFVIQACGLAENLDTFIDFLYKSPAAAKVTDLVAEPLISAKDFRGAFRIIEN